MAADEHKQDESFELPAFLDDLDPELRALLEDKPASNAPGKDPHPRGKQPEKKAPAQPRKKKKKKSPVLPILLAVLLLAGIGLGAMMLLREKTLPQGARVGGVALAGMTRKEAVQAVKDAYPFEEASFTLEVGGNTMTFSPAEMGAGLSAEQAVRDASEGTAVDIQPYVTLSEQAIRNRILEQAEKYAQTEIPASYGIQGEELVITVGTPRLKLDAEDLTAQVMDVWTAGEFRTSAQSGFAAEAAVPLDLDAVYQEVYIAPQEPYVDHTTLQAVPGADGLGFDAEAAKALYAAAAPGETIRVPLQTIAPAIEGDDVWFQDELGYALTPHSDNENRNANLALACSFLNGQIIQPGETFSYNDCVGERTPERGFLKAPAYSGTVLVDSPGGGVCQVSSTLFLATLYAELETVERVNHGFAVRYIPIGLDATVSYGTTDMKFKNNTQLPVKILAEVSDGYVRIRLMGTELRDYYVKMEYRAGDGHYTSAYTCHYDLQTDERIFREFHHRSSYLEDIRSQYGWIRSGEAKGTLIG